MDNEKTITVNVSSNTMRALWAVAKRAGPSRPALYRAALRVCEYGTRWEATNGAMVLLIPWRLDGGAGGAPKEPGVYVATASDVERRASIPARVWRSKEDGTLTLTRQIEPAKGERYDLLSWPNLPSVVPGEGYTDWSPMPGDDAPPHDAIGISSSLLSVLEPTVKTLRLGRVHRWTMKHGSSALDPVVFHSNADNGPRVIIMPMRLD